MLGSRNSDFAIFSRIPINNRVADKLDTQFRNHFGIPAFFDREDAQEQIEVVCELISPAFTRSPDLWRDVLDKLWVPIVEPIQMRADVLFDGMTKAPVETREVHANDGVGLALDSEPVQLREKPAEFDIIL